MLLIKYYEQYFWDFSHLLSKLKAYKIYFLLAGLPPAEGDEG
jgi:hypothetical protein